MRSDKKESRESNEKAMSTDKNPSFFKDWTSIRIIRHENIITTFLKISFTKNNWPMNCFESLL